jgi:nucleoside-diphosphate-sugar epimerase
MAKFTVTGGSGFLGTALIEALLDRGDEVVCINKSSKKTNHSNLRVFSAQDLTFQQLVQEVSGSRAVFHLATHFSRDDSDAEKTIATNISHSVLVAKACAMAEIKYFVNMESMSQHTDGVLENSQNFYSKTKVIGSRSIEIIGRGHFKIMNLALFDTYGLDDRRQKLIQILLESDERAEPMKLSPGDQLVDYLHKNDVVDGILSSLKYLEENQDTENSMRFRIGASEICTLREMVQKLETASGRSFNIAWGAREYRDGEMFYNWDFPPYLPNWKPNISMEVGFREFTIK